jgi:FkbM family methyltransferase
MLGQIAALLHLLRYPRRSLSLAQKNMELRSRLTATESELAKVRVLERSSEDPRVINYRERQALILIPRLLSLLGENETFVIVDAGAREAERDQRWRHFPPERMEFVGFEPDKEEAARLNAAAKSAGLKNHFVAAGLWGASGTIEFEHNNIGGGSSFLAQNRKLTDRWKFENPNEARLARDIFFPINRESMSVVSLADWAKGANVGNVDFLKLNVQGGEAEILNGAGPLLDRVLGILVEVAFVESYSGRPMFVDVDALLRQRGFCFFDLLAHHYVGRAESPIAAQHLTVANGKLGQLVSSWGQLIEGHALYFRDPIMRGDGFDFERAIKLAALTEAFGQVEFAFELLHWLSKQENLVAGERLESLRQLLESATEEYQALLRSDIQAARGTHSGL